MKIPTSKNIEGIIGGVIKVTMIVCNHPSSSHTRLIIFQRLHELSIEFYSFPYIPLLELKSMAKFKSGSDRKSS